MRKLIVLSGVVIALAVTSTAQASNTRTTVHSYRVAINTHIAKTWYWQDKGHFARTPTNHSERHTKSKAYLRWDNELWSHRQAVARHRTLTHPAIQYLSLWLCIHSFEGSWNNADTGHNGHYGGLQMTSPWGKGDYYVYRADYLTPYEQMRKAELGYKASGYSTTWLLGQWYHPTCIS